MTKRLLVPALIAVAAVLGITLESQANGLFRNRCGCGGGNVRFEERKVTAYRYVPIQREIDVILCRTVISDQKYTYTVRVPVTRDEQRRETVYVRTTREVDYKYYVMVPRTVTKVVKQTTYNTSHENVTETVPVCRLMRVTVTDRNGCPVTRCQKVTVMETRTRCVVKRTPIVRDVTVNEVVCDRVEKIGKRLVCQYVPQTRDVTVKVCSYERQTREGTRKVCTVVQEKAKRTVNTYQRVPYETTVRVCVRDCHFGHNRAGLFRRHAGCGCHAGAAAGAPVAPVAIRQ